MLNILFIRRKKIKSNNKIGFLTYLSLLKNNYCLKKKDVLLRIKNTYLPNLNLYLRIHNVN